MATDSLWNDEVIVQTKRWIERVVIGLNLCPFARSVFAHDRIRYWVTSTDSPEELLEVLSRELEGLNSADPGQCETTLVIHPRALTDFLEYNEFLEDANQRMHQLGFEGVFQIASFHPRYQFSGTDPEDITNYTNRSPYPMLHLLREDSVDQAISGPEEARRIVDRNLATMRKLGITGWRQLGMRH